MKSNIKIYISTLLSKKNEKKNQIVILKGFKYIKITFLKKMGRPLNVKELLLAKSKSKDLKLLQPQKKVITSKKEDDFNVDSSKEKIPNKDIDDIILSVQTSKKVDKLTKIPKRTNAIRGDSSAESSFECLLKNKPLDQMTKSCWDMYAKLHRVEINTMFNDKRYYPIRKLEDFNGYLKLDTITQFTLDELTQEGRSKNLVCIDNSGISKIDILSIILPVVKTIQDVSTMKVSEKTPLCCVVVNDDDQKQEFIRKIDNLQKAKFKEIPQLRQYFYINSLEHFADDVNKNNLNYHLNLKWIVFDFVDLNKLSDIDRALVNIKNRKIKKIFYIRRQYNLTLKNKTDETFDEILDRFIDIIKPGHKDFPEEFKFKSKMFNDVNILKIR